MSTTRCYHTSMAANNVPFFFFLRMKTANTVVRGVGKLTIQGCDYLQNSVKTVQKKKGIIKEKQQLWSKPRLSFYEKLPMPSHEQSRSSSNRQAQCSLLPTVCKALLTLRPWCKLVAQRLRRCNQSNPRNERALLSCTAPLGLPAQTDSSTKFETD